MIAEQLGSELEPPAGDRWGDPISDERVAELRELADRQRVWVDSAPDGQRNVEKSAFKGVNLTGADVFWLALYALAGPEGDLDAAKWQLRAALDDPNIGSSLALSALHLERANLFRAQLQGAKLVNAHLHGAQLQGASLVGAQLQGTILIETHLETLYVNPSRDGTCQPRFSWAPS